MFTKIIHPWREGGYNVKNLLPVPGENFSQKEKQKFFLNAVDFILFSNSSQDETMIDQILGNVSTECKAFKDLSIHKGLFKNKPISEETSYLLFVYCLKTCFLKKGELEKQALSCIQDKTAHLFFQQWIFDEKISGLAHKDVINPIESIRLSGNQIICFGGSYFIGINSFKKNSELNNNSLLIPSKKLLKFQDLLSRNYHGMCLSEVVYWLIKYAEAYDMVDVTDRYDAKIKYLDSIKNIAKPTGDVFFEYRAKTLKILKSLDSTFNIITVNSKFQVIHKVVITHTTLFENLDKFINLMREHNLDQLYVQMITHNHSIGMILVHRGAYFKIIINEPNTTNRILNMKYYPQSSENSILKTQIKKLYYFQKFDKTNDIIPIYCTCYSFNQPGKHAIQLETQMYFDECCNSTLLKLGLTLNSQLLINKALEASSINLSEVFNHITDRVAPIFVVKVLKCIPNLVSRYETDSSGSIFFLEHIFRLKGFKEDVRSTINFLEKKNLFILEPYNKMKQTIEIKNKEVYNYFYEKTHEPS